MTRGRPRKPTEELAVLGTYRKDRHGQRPRATHGGGDDGPPEELKAWSMFFRTGHDFFSDAADFSGAVDPRHAWPLSKEPAARRLWMKAARAAWRRVGREFLETWRPTDTRADPWAYKRFGPPPGFEDS